MFNLAVTSSSTDVTNVGKGLRRGLLPVIVPCTWLPIRYETPVVRHEQSKLKRVHLSGFIHSSEKKMGGAIYHLQFPRG
jgi:hypothetical protein